MKNLRIGVVGLGNIGKSLSSLITRNGYSETLRLGDKRRNIETISNSDILFLTVRSNDLPDILKQIEVVGSNDKLIVSFVTGISLDHLEETLDDYAVVRGSINIPVSIGKGTITYIPNENVNSQQLAHLQEILKGPELLQVRNEKLIDISTVLIGCMPAFTSFIAEEYIHFGIKYGFTAEEAKKLYLSTLEGTACLLKEKCPEEVISLVTTKGGITYQGLSYLEQSGVREILQDSLKSSLSGINLNKKD